MVCTSLACAAKKSGASLCRTYVILLDVWLRLYKVRHIVCWRIIRLRCTSSVLQPRVLIVRRHHHGRTYITRYQNSMVHAAFWHSQFEGSAWRNFFNIGFSSVSIPVYFTWVIVATSGSALFIDLTVSLHCWQMQKKVHFCLDHLWCYPLLAGCQKHLW